MTAGPNGTVVLTAAPDAGVATAARAVDGTRDTNTYELIGVSDLNTRVGKRVEVTGTLADGRVDGAEVSRESKGSADAKGADAPAQVTTTEEIEVNVHRLTVSAVRELPGECTLTP